MAKAEMVCPFSGKLCRECPVYRGRHYYLCFSKKYRGHKENPDEVTEVSTPVISEVNPSKRLEMAPIAHISAIDPFTTTLKDIK